uniref:Actin-related protein 2/3 complex subunit 3 n=1 Tax=Neobodo designis TaxID=312471 RepID=A0A7S1L886_NEODS|mmetsp:Transcript_16793/g.52131  ORF Transcript_16793/g.52131 Transcript_16793/m.52131 type:complete len:221 (+) Transcript_16793:36-698(+)|eukprot:CAMPEP_0174830686 /NCGR_PEP_ID=MMETSP1114-20130205/2660_1 /TAXON_ID=312471 /ORGANISM="Neobodo designis, Strain CCAP 1951/1" /LENGTH=220 /DNA_ID=CAMNT_0016064489 /DNA_START=32 /DNA_END=694 /DNA_ORIENTATION=-
MSDQAGGGDGGTSPPPQGAPLVPAKKYSSSFNGTEVKTLVGCGVYPVNYSAKSGAAGAGTEGPKLSEADAEAAEAAGGFVDIVDEALYYFKARMMMKTFPVEGAADRLSLWLTLYLQNCMRRLSKQPQPLSQAQAWAALQTLASERQTVPGDASYPFNGMYPKPVPAEHEALRDYAKQLRLEAGYRLVQRVYAHPSADGGPNKFWMPFAKADLLGHMMEK